MANMVWWEVETSSPEEFMRFHGKLHGWTFDQAFEDSELDASYWIIKDGSSGIGGLQNAPSDVVPVVGTRIYFEVEDLENCLSRS